MNIYDSGFLNLFSEKGAYIATQDKKLYGKLIADLNGVEPRYVKGVEQKQSFTFNYYFKVNSTSDLVYGTPVTLADTGCKWIVSVNIPHTEIYAAAYSMVWNELLEEIKWKIKKSQVKTWSDKHLHKTGNCQVKSRLLHFSHQTKTVVELRRPA